MKYAVFLLVIAFCSDAFGINTVSTLNVTQYLGRWYQMYADATVVGTFERNAFCVTADYTLRKDGKVGVLNSERLYSETGTQNNITGYAYIPDPAQPGKLKVHLDGVPVDAPYWVVKLGPPSFGEQGLYQYSVVTDNFQATLFVLARDVDTFRSQYDAEVKSWLAENGFTYPWNKPIATVQDDECLYLMKRASPYQTIKELVEQEY